MKLTKLSIESFQSWGLGTVEFTKPVTFVLGQNNVGKTSLARAIEVALRGASSLARSKTLVLADMIRTGAKGARLDAEIQRSGSDKPIAIRRTLTAKGIATHVNGSPATKEMYDFYAPADLLDPDGVFAVLCNVSGFFDLTAEKQKDVLEALIDQSVPAAAVAGLPMDSPHLNGLLKASPKTLHDIEDAYTVCYEARREANKAAAVTLAEPETRPDTMPDPAAIEAKLNGLREEERAMIAVVGEKAGERKALETQLSRADAAIAETEAALIALGTPDALAKAVADAQAHVKDVAALTDQSKAKTSRLANIKAFEKSLGAVKGKCVISDEVPCPLNNETKGRIMQGWAVERAGIEEGWGGSPTAKDLPEAQAKEKAAIGRAEGWHRQAKALEAMRAARVTLAAGLAAAPADHDMAPLVALRGRIVVGEGRLATARQMMATAARRAEQAQAKAEAQARLKDLETLVAAFGASGIPERLLSERLGALQARLNEILSGFGMTLALTTKPWRVLLNGIPAELASASERFRAGVAFQVALAELTKVRLVVVDAADVLDKTNRAVLFDLLATAIKGGLLEQAVVLATSQAPPKLEGLPDYVQGIALQRGESGATEVAA